MSYIYSRARVVLLTMKLVHFVSNQLARFKFGVQNAQNGDIGHEMDRTDQKASKQDHQVRSLKWSSVKQVFTS